MPEKKLICFDVDGTLVEDKTSFITLIKGLGCPLGEIMAIYRNAMAGKVSFEEAQARVSEIFRTSELANREYIVQIFSQIALKPGAVELIGWLKKKGYEVWLVSGAIDTHVADVAGRIGASGYCAHSSLEFDENGRFRRINYSSNQNPWKAKVVAGLAQARQIHPADVYFVGDGENDIDVFKITKGIAIAPYDPHLENIAWKKLMSLSEIKDIIE